MRETPRIVDDERFGAVVSYRDESIVLSQEQLETRRLELAVERYHSKGVRMKLRESTHSYRENSGMSSLTITLAEGEWADLFGALVSKPKRFFEVETSEFVGTDDNGETRTPSIPTIQKTLDRMAWEYGVILGYRGVPTGKTAMNGEGKEVDVLKSDEFGLCYRPNVTKVPKRLRNNAAITVDSWGAALPEADDGEQSA